VEHIALRQLEEYETRHHPDWLFFDTWLIITKVWFEVLYASVPPWMEDRIRKSSFDLVLLCDTDIPWIADPVRENGGARREELLDRYKKELDYYHMDWELVHGREADRFLCARKWIDKKLNYGTS
jgi:nicotinamide riboside kinase